jgi:glycolate oxidase FAD binding subunit
VRIEGLAGSVAYRTGRLRALLGAGWDAVGPEASAELWRGVRDVADFAGRAGSVWRVHLKATDAPALLAALRAGGEAPALLDWGGGRVWLCLADAGDGGAARLRGALAPLGGHATLVRAAPGVKAVARHPEAPAVARLTEGLMRAFDPKGLLRGAA